VTVVRMGQPLGYAHISTTDRNRTCR
jgi:hypothetical protein